MSLNTDVAPGILAALQAAGFPVNALPLAFAQAAFESSGFNHATGTNENNYSGLTYGGRRSQIATGAVASELQPDGPSRYADYPGGVNDWAKDFFRFLCFNRGAGRPIDAVNTTDYVHRLKTNGYFGANETLYLNGVNSWIATLTPLFTAVFHREA
jgi:hypothetical protein